MVRDFFKILIFLNVFQSCVGQTNKDITYKENYIDGLQNAKQITRLISTIDKNYKDLTINKSLTFKNYISAVNYQKIADSLKVQPWTKADFDNNGLTDLLVIGNGTILCIMDMGGNYEIKRLSRRMFQEFDSAVVENNQINYFFVIIEADANLDYYETLKKVSLIYKFGDFIEVNQQPSNHNIEKIEYSTSTCFGSCSVFSLTINSDKSANWNAEMYNLINNKEIQGSFNTLILENDYNELVNLLNYIDFESLNDDYSVNWTDDRTSVLKITYDGGKVKSIRDYGLIGTYGLNRVHQLLYKLRETQKWTK